MGRGRPPYYQREHESAYRRIAHEHKTQWNDLFDEDAIHDTDDFPIREFLERVLSRFDVGPDVFEYGCGTGLAACFLAQQGFRVDAVDLIPQATELARAFAHDRGIEVNFGVQDVCRWDTDPIDKRYDLIVDSFCLQSIVLDRDRAVVLAGVRERLKPTGHYVLSTAMYEPGRRYDEGFRYELLSGICYESVAAADSSDTIRIDGVWFRPHRRHLAPAALRQELASAGLTVVLQEGELGGDVVCVRAHQR